MPRSGGKLDQETLTVEMIIGLERLDDHVVDRHPDRSTPVGVAAEHGCPPLARLVVHRVDGAVHRVGVGVLLVVLGDRTDPVGREELLLVEHVPEHPLQTGPWSHGHQVIKIGVEEVTVDLEEMGSQFRAVFDIPIHPGGEAGTHLALGSAHVAGREHRDEALDRADLHRDTPVRQNEHVVVEAIILVPETAPAELVDRLRHPGEMSDEFRPHVLVDRIVFGQSQRDLKHGHAVEGHPGGAVGLLELPTRGEWFRTVEDRDVVEAQESSLEETVPVAVLAIHPPGEINQQLLEDTLQKRIVLTTGASLLAVESESGPRVHGRIHIGEVPLVGRHLPVRMRVPLAEKEYQLTLGKGGIYPCEGGAVKGEIPGAVVGVLPRIGHREDIAVEDVPPLGIPEGMARRWCRLGRVPPRPLGLHQVIELLAPEQTGVGLTGDLLLSGRER